MENTTMKREIPLEIKENMMEFNQDEVKSMFQRLDELHRLKQTQKEKQLNTEHLLHETQRELRQLKNKKERKDEDITSLKMRLKSLLYQLNEFDKSIEDNNTILNTLSLQADTTEDLIGKLQKVKQMNEEVK